MDKKSFLWELKWRLRFRLDEQAVNDVLADYEEYFESGVGQGKSEAELCTQFGSPATISAALAGEGDGKIVTPYFTLPILGVGLVLLLVFTALLYSELRVIWSVLLPYLMLLISCCSVWLCRKEIGRTPRPHTIRRAWMATVALAVVMGLIFVCMYSLWELVDWVTMMGILQLDHIGPTMAMLFYLTTLAIGVLWCWEVISAKKLAKWQLALLPINAMFIAQLCGYVKILYMMSDPEKLHSMAAYALVCGLWQLLPLVLVFFTGRRKNG